MDLRFARTSSRARLMCFFFNDTATTEIYTLSLHDALPILRKNAVTANCFRYSRVIQRCTIERVALDFRRRDGESDRKSTRLNSSHGYISYAVFCLKKKTKTMNHRRTI